MALNRRQWYPLDYIRPRNNNGAFHIETVDDGFEVVGVQCGSAVSRLIDCTKTLSVMLERSPHTGCRPSLRGCDHVMITLNGSEDETLEVLRTMGY